MSFDMTNDVNPPTFSDIFKCLYCCGVTKTSTFMKFHETNNLYHTGII